MPSIEYFLASESLSVDLNTNTISVYHILNEVSLDEIPGRLPLLAIVAAWIFDESEIRDRKELQAKIEVRPPGVTPRVYRANITAQKRFMNIHLQLYDVEIVQPGDLVIELFLDDRHEATHTIDISASGD